jgi:hypothetical protein
LWIWAFCVLAAAGNAEMFEPVFGYRKWLLTAWHLGRIAFLVYSGFLLIEDDQEIGNLKYTIRSLEELIAQFQAGGPD